ncbi:MAG TPA: ABC transporter ATP-binding protein [Gemmatales bacterium]|nr:ABC transporter ATP-binding protein [Gemmatales bacterium]
MPLLSLQHITHRYGAATILNDVSLELEPGAIGLLGPNGAGKSTLLKILMGLVTPTSGTGTLLDKNLRGPAFPRRRLIGYMSEADALVPGLKGAEYVALAGELCGMPKRDASRRAHELLTYLGLDDARYRKLEEYSTGMKQRIKLAQALVHDPPLLLLDEPTSGLDPAGREAMLQLLGTLATNHGKSFLLCTHVLGDVERTCETTVILHQGRVLCQERTDTLCSQRHNNYRLRVEGPRDGLRTALLEAKIDITEQQPGIWIVALPEGMQTDHLFRLAARTGALLTELQPDDDDLEKVFHRLLQGANAPPFPLKLHVSEEVALGS